MDTSSSPSAAFPPDAERSAAPAGAPAELPRLARDTTPENPWPLSKLSHSLHGWVQQAPDAWVEGQVIEVNERARVCYVTLRDLQEEVSVSVTLFRNEIARLAREHNDAQIISLGGRMQPVEQAREMVRTFLATEFTGEARHERRIAMVSAYEADGTLPDLP